MVDVAEILARCPNTVGGMLDWRTDKDPSREAFRYPDEADRWVSMSWDETRGRVHELAAGLLALGLQLEQRVGIASSTRIEWILADLAINCAGGATTTVYPNTQDEDVHYILTHSDCKVVFAENPDQLAKLIKHDDLRTQLSKIILVDGEDESDKVMSWAQFEKLGAEHLAANPDSVKDAMARVTPDTLATLIYTSGTTGRPKGVELVHRSWAYEGAAMDYLQIIDESDLQYLWLPLSHVFGKCLIACQLAIGFPSAVDGRIDRIVAGLGEVGPTWMCGAPRIFEKVRAAVMTATGTKGPKARIARWAFSVGRKSNSYRLAGKTMPPHLAAQYALAHKLVFSKLHARLGGNIKFMISGSAKLSPQVQSWFYSAGLQVTEGYGSTETSAIAFVDHPARPHMGTVGQVSPGSETRLAADGEILVRGPGIMRGYHMAPDLTAEVLDADGWFHTGDIGVLDKDGYLTITDRKKDLIKTSGGKYVAPQKVESVITANIPYVSQAVVLGEGRKYIVALLTLDEPQLKKWAEKRGKGDLSYAELTQLPEIKASINRFMARANGRLERWETVKRFAILDRELSVTEGGVTPNMKIRRNAVAENYADIVDSLYDKED